MFANCLRFGSDGSKPLKGPLKGPPPTQAISSPQVELEPVTSVGIQQPPGKLARVEMSVAESKARCGGASESIMRWNVSGWPPSHPREPVSQSRQEMRIATRGNKYSRCPGDAPLAGK